MTHTRNTPLPLALAALCLAALTSCARAAPPRMGMALNTLCTLNAYGDGTDALYDEAFALLDSIEGSFSATIATSDVSAINRAAGGETVEVSPDVAYVLTVAQAVAEASGGAFNFAAGPLITLWGSHAKEGTTPTPDEVASALALCNWQDVEVAGETVRLAREGMKVNLGAIAKGYAADRVCSLLRERGVRQAVVDLGGNVCVLGVKAHGKPWVVGIKNPRDPAGPPLLALEVTGGISVVTSGSYERYYVADDDRVWHHIFDCATGYPAASGLLSVTVVASSSMAADALATAAFVLGVERTLALQATLETAVGESVAFVFVDEEGAVTASAALRGSLRFVSTGSAGSAHTDSALADTNTGHAGGTQEIRFVD